MSEDPWGERDCTFAECWDEGRWVTCCDAVLILLYLLSVFANDKEIHSINQYTSTDENSNTRDNLCDFQTLCG